METPDSVVDSLAESLGVFAENLNRVCGERWSVASSQPLHVLLRRHPLTLVFPQVSPRPVRRYEPQHQQQFLGVLWRQEAVLVTSADMAQDQKLLLLGGIDRNGGDIAFPAHSGSLPSVECLLLRGVITVFGPLPSPHRVVAVEVFMDPGDFVVIQHGVDGGDPRATATELPPR